MDLEQTIRDRLAVLEPQAIEIQDESQRHAGHAGARESGGGHFEVTVVSKHFEGQPSLTRHRMVYETVSDLIPARIHALSIRAYTPAERTAIGNQPPQRFHS